MAQRSRRGEHLDEVGPLPTRAPVQNRANVFGHHRILFNPLRILLKSIDEATTPGIDIIYTVEVEAEMRRILLGCGVQQENVLIGDMQQSRKSIGNIIRGSREITTCDCNCFIAELKRESLSFFRFLLDSINAGEDRDIVARRAFISQIAGDVINSLSEVERDRNPPALPLAPNVPQEAELPEEGFDEPNVYGPLLPPVCDNFKVTR